MDALSREQFLQGRTRTIEWVPLSEGRGVYVRSLTPRERGRFEQMVTTGDGKDARMDVGRARGALVALSACDAGGAPLFTEDDADALNDLPDGADVEAIFQAAMRVCKLRSEDIEAVRKKSDPTRNGNSPTNLPAN